MMIKTHIKTAIRTMRKNKVFTFINLAGLTVGLAACMLVLTVVLDDLSYDRFWNRSADLYKANISIKMGEGMYEKNAFTPIGLGTELKERFPEVEEFSEVYPSDLYVKLGDTQSNAIKTSVLMMDPSAVRMFGFSVKQGSVASFVAGQDNILISESFSKRYFKGQDPVGKVIYDVPTWADKPKSYLVTAVIRDIPQNTHLRADALILSIPKIEHLEKNTGTSNYLMYYLMRPGVNIRSFENKVNRWYSRYMDQKMGQTVFGFQPITDVYLHSDFDAHTQIQSSIRVVCIFGGVGAFLLLIACINFVNLSTAKAMQRLKESGIRKILGAQRSQLIGQFLAESMLFFLISTCLAIIVYALSLPLLERFVGHGLTRNLLTAFPLFAATISGIFLISFVTGIYPAWLLSGFDPAHSLRGRFFSSSLWTARFFRKALVVVQFSIAIVTLVALLVVRSQLTYLYQKDLGYDKDNLLYTEMINWKGKSGAFKTELLKLPGIVSAGISGWVPRTGLNSIAMTIDHPLNPNEKVEINFIQGDFDFVKTIRLKLRKGRFLSNDFGIGRSDTIIGNTAGIDKDKDRSETPVLLTEATAKAFGINNTEVRIGTTSYKAVGIVKDFYYESLYHTEAPAFITASEEANYGGMFVRVVPGKEQQALKSLHTLWQRFYPDRLLNIDWVSDILRQQYQAEQTQQALFIFFSALMLFISSLGVLGLAIHAAEQRVKEIGIRKVLGASVSSIIALLSTDFIKLVFVALIIACPIAWWAMNKWLADFAYRIEISWWVFALAGCLSVLIALLTAGWQATKAALANPVDSLRDE